MKSLCREPLKIYHLQNMYHLVFSAPLWIYIVNPTLNPELPQSYGGLWGSEQVTPKYTSLICGLF